MVAKFSRILFQIQYPVMKKSAASNPCAERSLIPGGSSPVFLSSMICRFQLALSSSIALIILHDPHNRFLKYCLDCSSVPQLSKPVEMTPGIMITGNLAEMPSDRAESPIAKES